MNCKEARWLLATSASAEALPHLQTCAECQVWRSSRVAESAHISPELEEKIVRALNEDLRPVRPVRSNWLSSVLLLSGSAGVIGSGILALGLRGWDSTGLALRAYLGATIALGLAMGAYLLPRLVVPGELLRIRLFMPVMLVCFAALAAVSFYPARMYPGFARAVLTCVSIGLVASLITASISYATLRRGFVVSPIWTGAVAGTFSGLSGLAVLSAFCPHLDFGHYLIGHAGMLLLGTAAGAFAGLARSK